MADALCRLPRVLLDGRPAARALWQQRPPRPAGRGAVLSLPGRNPIADTRPGAARGRLLCLPHSRARRLLHRGRRGLSLRRSPLRSGRPRAPEPRGRSPCSPAAAGRSPSCIPAGFSPGRCWAGRWYSTLCPMTTAVSPPAPPGAALPAASSPLWPEPGPHGLSCGPGFLLSIIYCILFCYPTVTTRTTASPPSAPL